MERVIIAYERNLFDKVALDAFKALGADVMEYSLHGVYFENAFIGLSRYLPTNVTGVVAVQRSRAHGYKPMRIVCKGNAYTFEEIKNVYMVVIGE